MLQLNCIITLSPLIGPAISVSSRWLKNGVDVVSDSRIVRNQTNLSLQNYSANLFFMPLDNNNPNDSGDYQCNFTVSGDEYVIPDTITNSTTLTISGIFSSSV